MSVNTNASNHIVIPIDASPSHISLTPKLYTLVVLLLIATIAGIGSDSRGIINAGIAMITAILLDGAIFILQSRKRLFSDGGVITGLIVALVLGSSTAWYIIAGSTAIAIGSKHVFKIKNKPIFNPAALGLLVAIFLFTSDQSWWGAFTLLPVRSFSFLLIGGFLVTERVNKFPQVLTFLGGYFVLLLVMGYYGVGIAGDALRTPFINSALFLAFFMLTDLPTSPGKYKDQIWFGMITAIVSIIIYLLFGGLTYLLIGLLVANGWNALRVHISSRTKTDGSGQLTW